MSERAPLLARISGPVRKVAVLRASRIGDFLCATPAIRALRAALPAAEFTLVGLPFVRELVERSPYLDRFVEFPGFPGMADQLFDPRRTLAFFAEMQAEGFDLVVQMHGSGVYSNPCALMFGARVTAGFVRPGDPQGRLDEALDFPEAGHEAARVLALATHLGAPDCGLESEFPLWDADREAAASLLDGAALPLVGLHAGAREATKRWPPERFAAAGLALQSALGGTLVLLGGPEDRAPADAVARAIATHGPHGAEVPTCLNLAGKTSVPAAAAVIERLAVLLTNDSGPAHIAYALRTPTVTIFGGTDPARWGPPAYRQFRAIFNPVSCWPCDYGECPVGYRCLAGVMVEQVVAAAIEVIPRR